MAKDNLIKVEIFLTKENYQLLKQVDVRMVSQNYYVNAAMEATAQMKKFKDLRILEKEKKDEEEGKDKENNS